MTLTVTKVRFQMRHLAAARSSHENNHTKILAQLATMKEQTVEMQKRLFSSKFSRECFCMLHAEAFATRQRVRFSAKIVAKLHDARRNVQYLQSLGHFCMRSVFRTFSFVRNNEVADKGPELCVACATADWPASRPRGPDSEA